MRITCPNCNAQYEIAEEVVPADGRDVQCSSCATTWFQPGRSRRAVEAAPPARRADDALPGPDDQMAPPRRQRAPVDEQALDILREERAREERLRAADKAAADGQSSDTASTEDEADPRDTAALERARMAAAATVARVRDGDDDTDDEAEADDAPKAGDDDPDKTVAPRGDSAPVSDQINAAIAQAMRDASSGPGPVSAPAPPPELPRTYDERVEDRPQASASRRDLLPDIEEINSSLKPDERAAEAAADQDALAHSPTAGGGGGFRLGFVLIMLVLIAVLLAYLFAAPLARAVPALSGVLDMLIGAVDAVRVWLHTGAESLLQRIAPEE